MTVDTLAAAIRLVDPRHNLGAGQLAEKLHELGWRQRPSGIDYKALHESLVEQLSALMTDDDVAEATNPEGAAESILVEFLTAAVAKADPHRSHRPIPPTPKWGTEGYEEYARLFNAVSRATVEAQSPLWFSERLRLVAYLYQRGVRAAEDA